MGKLTIEQEKVVHHPIGCHARVLAVAGSGKSTTMAHRIKHLVIEQDVRPAAIQVLMFNALARKQFASHLDKTGLPASQQPIVHTFHSFSFRVIVEAVKASILPASTQFWLADKSELIWLTLNRSITELEKAKRVPPEAVDPEEALHAISLWKGSLIPPRRAGSYTSPYLPLVYDRFEQMRLTQSAVTYDDFIPMAIDVLENNPNLYQKYCRDLRHLIVDEYQDVNLGQQTLIELLAGDQVDVMVVGDDDQTIYEWRGARPNYIISDFQKLADGKPVLDYRLSRSFRFGPVIAQCAANVIACNTNRVDKPLIAFQTAKPGFVQIYQGGYNAIKELAEQVIALTQTDQVPPREITVLARLYAQMDNLEAEFLTRGIPYRVDGQEPFFKRREISTLLDYIRLVRDFQLPMNEQIGGWLLSVANKPSRMLSRSTLERIISAAKQRRLSAHTILEQAPGDPVFGLNRWQARPIYDLLDFLLQMQAKLHLPNAGDVLSWMVDRLDYLAYFQNYYGKGENSDEKAHAVTHFIKYVEQLGCDPLSLLDRLAELDTTQGKPEEELIVFTTIFRTKGLEYDYVVIPQCDENLLPYVRGERVDVYDTWGRVKEPTISSSIESERRLFYVALTRARKGVLIGASSMPSRFLEEIQLKQTQTMMDAVQFLANGDDDGMAEILQTIGSATTNPVLMTNLIEGYLQDMGQTKFAERVQEKCQRILLTRENSLLVEQVT